MYTLYVFSTHLKKLKHNSIKMPRRRNFKPALKWTFQELEMLDQGNMEGLLQTRTVGAIRTKIRNIYKMKDNTNKVQQKRHTMLGAVILLFLFSLLLVIVLCYKLKTFHRPSRFSLIHTYNESSL